MKVCNQPGCPELVDRKRTHCEAHTVEGHNWHTSTHKNPAGWKRIRRSILKRDGHTCVLCGLRATHVDHLIPTAWGGDPTQFSNLRALCSGCHKKKTILENQIGRKLLKVGDDERRALIAEHISQWQ